MSRYWLCLVVLVVGGLPSAAFAAERPDLDSFLESGQLAEGAAALSAHLNGHPDDQQAKFGLGVVQFLSAVEGLAQDHYRYGLLAERELQVPLLRMPVPPNEKPDRLSYAQAREVVQRLVTRLETAEKTLASVDTTDVKLPIHFGKIRLDLNGDGVAGENERFWSIYANFNRTVTRQNGESFVIGFDGGDVHWLRGYCHLLMAMGEVVLAHDWQEQFERTAHLFFSNVETPHRQLNLESTARTFSFNEIADSIAFLHLINFEVRSPERMARALEHLEAMAEQSHRSWGRILIETDDDREWLPNPAQTGVIPNVRVTAEMIAGWGRMMQELQAVFRGEKLLPYWRGGIPDNEWAFGFSREVGVNFRKVFTQPTRLDLVLWVQGTAATPYLESYQESGKPPVDTEVFEQMRRLFGGEFIGFAIWFN